MPHEAKENLLFFSIYKTVRMLTYLYTTEDDKIEIYQYKI